MPINAIFMRGSPSGAASSCNPGTARSFTRCDRASSLVSFGVKDVVGTVNAPAMRRWLIIDQPSVADLSLPQILRSTTKCGRRGSWASPESSAMLRSAATTPCWSTDAAG